MKNLKTTFVVDEITSSTIGLDRIPNISETVILDKYEINGNFKVIEVATVIRGIEIEYVVFLKRKQ